MDAGYMIGIELINNPETLLVGGAILSAALWGLLGG